MLLAVTVRVLPPPRVSTPVPSAVTVAPPSTRVVGAVATKPPVNSMASLPSPRVSVPVLLNVVAPAMVLLLPVNDTEYPFAAVVRPVVMVVSPWNAMVPVVFVTVTVPALTVLAKVTPLLLVTVSVGAVTAPLKVIPAELAVSVSVVASTVLLNVVPPLLVTVSVPMSVPMAPETVTAPVVFKVRFDEVPAAVPVIAAREIGVAAPAPTVSVTPSESVASDSVICQVDVPPMVLVPVTVRGLPPLKSSPPVPSAVTVAPLSTRVVGAIASRPPVNSVVPPPPRVSVPVL